MKIYLLPIEPFEHRYTEQWFRYWPDELAKEGWEVEVIGGTPIGDMEAGEFLDPTKTWIWKGSQLEILAKTFPLMNDGDIVLTLDGWGPATTAVSYMRDTTGKDVKLAAFFHAGSYDPHDFLARSGCRYWGLDVERGWLKSCDLVLVGSEFHVEMIENNLGIQTKNVAVTGYPIHQSELEELAQPVPFNERSNLVIFPHRLAPEKQPNLFDKAREIYKHRFPGDVAFVKTRDACKTKREYYQLLGKAKVVVSFAQQETFGIAMQEGIALGAWAVAPNRLSYKTVIGNGGGLFNDLDEAVTMIGHYVLRTDPAVWDGYHELAIKRASEALKGLIK